MDTGCADDKELLVLQSGGGANFAWTLVRYSEQAGSVRGTSLMVWQFEQDGAWRIRMCSLNGSDGDGAA